MQQKKINNVISATVANDGTAAASSNVPDWLLSHYIVPPPRKKCAPCDVAFYQNCFVILLFFIALLTHLSSMLWSRRWKGIWTAFKK